MQIFSYYTSCLHIVLTIIFTFKVNVFFPQAVCEYGRETIESLGRKRRSIASNQTSESEEDMTLSQEILVLDFGDDKASESLRQETSSAEFGKGK